MKKIDTAVAEIAKQDKESPLTASLVGKMKKLNNVVTFVRQASTERKTSLQECLDACKKFWPGLEKLRGTLRDVQGKIETQGEPHFKPEAIEELIKEHEVSLNNVLTSQTVFLFQGWIKRRTSSCIFVDWY